MAQTLITTGLGNKVAGLVELFSGGSLIVALILTMLVSLVLGCGVPTAAAYSLVAIVVAPTIVKMGVSPLAAHFFAFYFAVISAVTPPVALASLAGAGLAKANYLATSWEAFKFAIAGFIIPFLVIYNPAIILEPTSWHWALGTAIAVPLGMTALTAAIYNCGLVPFRPVERLLAALTAGLMCGYAVMRHIDELPLEYPMLALGVALGIVLLRMQIAARRRAFSPGRADAGVAVRTAADS